MYDVPNAQLNVSIELNMQGEKITRFVSNFQKLAMIEYPFEHGENRSVLAFANDEVSTNDKYSNFITLLNLFELFRNNTKKL